VGVGILWSVARSDWGTLSLNGWSLMAGTANHFSCVCLFRPPYTLHRTTYLNLGALSITTAR
jgi:hypothetical protein